MARRRTFSCTCPGPVRMTGPITSLVDRFTFPLLGSNGGVIQTWNLRQADTKTIGMVIDSPFSAPALKTMRLSVDYYDIEVDGAIGTPGHNTVYQQCLDPQYNALIGSAPGTYTGEQLAAGSPLCALINREYIDDGVNDSRRRPKIPGSLH